MAVKIISIFTEINIKFKKCVTNWYKIGPKELSYCHMNINYYIIFSFLQTDEEHEEPMEVFIMKKLNDVCGVIELIDVFTIPDGYEICTSLFPDGHV